MYVDALNDKGEGKGNAGVQAWKRDPKEKGKSSCAHCVGRLIELHTERDC